MDQVLVRPVMTDDVCTTPLIKWIAILAVLAVAGVVLLVMGR
jgi:hypothetical protein